MMLACEDLNAGYGPVPILYEVGLEVDEGERVAVLGKNGMGKTTLLRALLGLVDRYSGRVVACGEDVSGWVTHRIARLGVSYVPQEAPIFESLTVEENLRLGALRVKDDQEAPPEVAVFMDRLRERAKQPAGTLSGGEQKMLIVTRALIGSPRVVLLDEISEGLQPSLRSVVSDLLRAYSERCGASVLLVEQNLEFALGASDACVVLNSGRIVEEKRDSRAVAKESVERHMTL
jgi:ABC-type branched-subunit amino acid transport system ATPase component